MPRRPRPFRGRRLHGGPVATRAAWVVEEPAAAVTSDQVHSCRLAEGTARKRFRKRSPGLHKLGNKRTQGRVFGFKAAAGREQTEQPG